uniref:Uncharacterized protein n=1 Tax=Rhizophora mucronata TaxID=61149 RepID=A0A2P2Q369_RHIMU
MKMYACLILIAVLQCLGTLVFSPSFLS